jgi:hypothetical protein
MNVVLVVAMFMMPIYVLSTHIHKHEISLPVATPVFG